MLQEMSRVPDDRFEPRLRYDSGAARTGVPPSAGVRPPPRRTSAWGWGAGFLMGVVFLAVLLLGGWIALEWFIFPAMDKSAGQTASAPMLQTPVLPDSSLRTGSALTPVPMPKDIPEVVVPLPPRPVAPAPTAATPPAAPSAPASAAPAATPANPAPAAQTPGSPASSAVATGETTTVGGSGISLHAGPSGTDPVVATRARGTLLHVFARQNGWVQVGDSQPLGWGWNGLLQAAPAADPATPKP